MAAEQQVLLTPSPWEYAENSPAEYVTHLIGTHKVDNDILPRQFGLQDPQAH